MKSVVICISLLFCSLLIRGQIDTLLLCDPSDEVQLIAPSDRAGYRWDPWVSLSNPTIRDPIASPVANTLYIVEMLGDLTGENLIVNPDFEEGNIGFESDYPFTDRIFTQGQYGISTSAALLNGIFFTDCPDHTSGEGMMMVVDGSPIEGQKVWCQTVEVKPNTQYAFSTWLTSVLGDNPAELQFSINDSRLGQVFTAVEDVCQWRQFYEIWDSGDTSQAEICIINKNEERNGNDFALDDFLFAETEDILYDSTFVIVKEVETDVTITVLPECGASNGQLSVETTGIDGRASFSIDGISFQEHSFFSQIHAGEYDILVKETTSAQSEFNTCIYNTSVLVGQKPCPIYIPNAFHRGSRNNGSFKITPHPDFTGLYSKLNIIDKWGNQVFYSNDHKIIEAGWDGSVDGQGQAMSGVYVYILEVDYPDRATQRFMGEITLF